MRYTHHSGKKSAIAKDDQGAAMQFHEQLKILKITKHVHKNWYWETYPDVAALGMDPAEHYLRYGAQLGRNPGKNFNTQFYLDSYSQVQDSGLNPLVYYWLYGRERGHSTKPKSAKARVAALSANLFSFGFTSEPLADLEVVATSGSDPLEMAEATRELALWHLKPRTLEGFQTALQLVENARAMAPHLKLRRQLAIIELVCLYLLESKEQAQEALERAIRRGEVSADLRLAAANLQDSPRQKLEQINLALSLHGIPPISFSGDVNQPLYDRMTTPVTHPSVLTGPKISILLAAYEAQDTIATALRSLQEQTWKNIEILVLDDCSPTNGTRNVTEKFARLDPRIKYVAMPQNGGAYVARNHGLDLATGDFITIHDADDWSHPLKLEIQARFLMDNDVVLGCTSEQARCTDTLEFTKIRGGGAFTVFNTSSFMWKVNPVRDALGYWDTVRFGADNEFIRRMRVVFGKGSFVKMETGPLSFQREAISSITGDPIKGIDIGGYYGVRKEYLLAQEHYHAQPVEALCYKNDPNNRPFPVPQMMNEARATDLKQHFDLVIYGDFRAGSPDVRAVVELIEDRREGWRVALVEAPDYQPTNGNIAWDPEIRNAIDGIHVQVLVFGDDATCDEELWITPQAKNRQLRLLPSVTIRAKSQTVDAARAAS